MSNKRPPGRRGGGGTGPRSPAHGTSGGRNRGTKHTAGSSTGSRAMMWAAVAIFLPGLLVFLAALGYVFHAYKE